MTFDKLIAYVGHAFMLLLVFFSVYFYQERMLHTDNAYGILTLINTENFIIPHYRYPLVLTQFLPIVAIKLGASLKVVIMAYSAGFYLLYYACFLLALYAYKNIKVSLLIVLSLLVTTSEIFFLQTEIAHGLIFSSLFYAWLSYGVVSASTFKNVVYQISGVMIFLIAVLFHPLSALFMGLILAWNMLEKRNWFDVNGIAFLVLVFLVLFIKAKLTPSGSYEDSFYPSKEVLWNALTNLDQVFVFRFFMARLEGLYLLPTIMLLLTVIWYGYKRHWLKLLFLLLVSVGYVVLASAMFKGDSEIMMERIFLLYGAIVSLGFVHVLFDVSSTFNQPKINVALTVLVVGCLVAGVVKILEASVKYNYRLSLVKQQADAAQLQEGSKFYVLNKDVAYPFAMWANGCEQILYSALHHPNNIKTVYIFNDEADAQKTLSEINTEMFLMTPFYFTVYDEILNKKYFLLKPDTYKYLKLN
jgi:hypothetical protein